MTDTPGVLVVKDASKPALTRNVGGTTDANGTFYGATNLRADGNDVGVAYNLPVVDAAAGTALAEILAKINGTIAPRAAQAITMTVVTLPAGVSILAIAFNSGRKSLQILNIGTGFATVKSFPAAGTGGTIPTAPGQASATSNAVVAGQGYPLEAASAAGHQGGSTPVYDGAATSTDEWDAISPTGTTILVMEGN